MSLGLDRRFILQWVLITTIGWLMGQSIGIYITGRNYPEVEIRQLSTSPLYWGVFGLILGFSQWIAFRKNSPGLFKWVYFTAGSMYLAALCVKLINLSGFELSPIFAQLLGSTILGYCQYLVLRERSKRATLWILAVVISWIFTQQLINS